MKVLLSSYGSTSYWRYVFLTPATGWVLLQSLGAVWLAVESLSFFNESLSDTLINSWPLFLIISAIAVLWSRRPVVKISERLIGRDINLEIRIADLFSIEGAKVISTNTTFDSDINPDRISPKSLQGQFTEQHYDDIAHLDRDLEAALDGEEFEELRDGRAGKIRLYSLGTVAKIRPRGKTHYLVALANMNRAGVAQANFSDLKVCLARLWEFIGSSGDLQPVVIPLIGSGHSRLTQTRTELAKEIIASFVAACVTRKFCEKFTLVISPSDYRQHSMDLYELADYLRYKCKYTEFKTPDDPGDGEVAD